MACSTETSRRQPGGHALSISTSRAKPAPPASRSELVRLSQAQSQAQPAVAGPVAGPNRHPCELYKSTKGASRVPGNHHSRPDLAVGSQAEQAGAAPSWQDYRDGALSRSLHGKHLFGEWCVCARDCVLMLKSRQGLRKCCFTFWCGGLLGLSATGGHPKTSC